MFLFVASLFAIKTGNWGIPATCVSVMVCFTTVETGIRGSCFAVCIMRPCHVSVVTGISRCRVVSRAWPYVLGREVTAKISWVPWPPGNARTVPFATRVAISCSTQIMRWVITIAWLGFRFIVFSRVCDVWGSWPACWPQTGSDARHLAEYNRHLWIRPPVWRSLAGQHTSSGGTEVL